MMLCTAGHVDHGKTRLVKMLTGCMTSRLKEEMERGLTIELGFAPCFLGGNLCAGIVDVPGHEKFVRNMVAGVSGIDLAILVVAADDGVMPQTVEHVQIMELLGVRHGLVALTKIDLVAPDRVEARRGEIAAFLRGTFLDGAPVCPVSSETFDGFPEFYDTLVARIGELKRERRPGVFRMPVERAFTRPGFGAVVTGIPVDGRVGLGDRVERVPGHEVGHVRGMQCFLREAAEGGAGQCLALNVPEFGKIPPRRGDVLSVPGYAQAARVFHLRLRTVPTLDTPLKNAEDVRFHTGTAEQAGRLFLLEDKILGSGGSALTTVVTAEPIVAASRDRFILRRPSPAMTVGGGEILLVSAADRRPRRAEVLADLREFEELCGKEDPRSAEGRRRRAAWALRRAPRWAATVDELARASMLTSDDARDALAGLVAAGSAVALEGGAYVEIRRLRDCGARLDARIEELAGRGGEWSVPLSELRQGFDWPAALWDRLFRDREASGRIRLAGDRVLLAATDDALPPADRELAERMRTLFARTAYHSPHPDDLPGVLGVTPARARSVLDYLLARRDLLRIADNVVLAMSRFREAQQWAVEVMARDGVLHSQDFRDHLATSRKYAMAILDFMDLRRITVRVQNDRRVVPGYEKRLL